MLLQDLCGNGLLLPCLQLLWDNAFTDGAKPSALGFLFVLST